MNFNTQMIIPSMATLAAFLIFLSYFKSAAILRPKKRRTPVLFYPEQFRLPFETVEFRTSDNIALKGWFIPSREDSDKTLIVCHGWGENRGDMLNATHFLYETGINLFYFDFRCSGESGGSLSSVGYLETRDLDAAIDFLQTTRPETSEYLGILGKSMGGAAATFGMSR